MTYLVKRWDGAAWITLFDADDYFLAEAGDVCASIRSSKAGWLKFDGTAYANADTGYADLWSQAPASWKSGSTLTIPDMTGRVPMGGGTIGATGGANSVTITSGNLPTHTHDIDHDHGSVTSGAGSSHTHGFAHTHTTDSPGDHTHGEKYYNKFDAAAGAYNGQRPWDASSYVTGTVEGDPAGAHTHTTNSQSTSTTGGEAAHTHSVDLPALGTTASGNGGFANTALDTTPAHLRLNFFIKT